MEHSPFSLKESGMTERLTLHFTSLHFASYTYRLFLYCSVAFLFYYSFKF